MNLLQAILFGIVQGLTEFIPVSSSGHLVLLHEAMGITDTGLVFDVALHFGTLLAMVIYFYKDIQKLVLGLSGKNDYQRLAWFLALATIPAAVLGFLLQDLAETTFRSPLVVAFNLILVALLMLVAEKVAAGRKDKTPLKKTSLKQAVAIGFAQAAALVPGVSRSGATITTGLFGGLDRVSATRFSFLLGIPIMIGAVAKVLLDEGSIAQVSSEAGIFTAGVLAALLSGVLAIRFLLRYLAGHTLAVFAYYRIALGIITLLIAL